MRSILTFVITLVALCLTAACSSIDCPLENKVACQYRLNEPLADTLSIFTKTAKGADTVLLNRAVATDSFALPMSFHRETDVLIMKRSNTAGVVTLDTVTLTKTNLPHFEAPDCGVVYFHRIVDASTTRHGIDSLLITDSNIDYNSGKTHITLYFKSRIR